MVGYRREKLVLDRFRSLASRVRVRGVPKNPIFECGYLDFGLKGASFNGFSSLCSNSQRLGTRGVVGGVNRNFHNPFLLRAKNFHNVDNSRPTGPRRWFEWFQNSENGIWFVRKLNLVMLGSAALIMVYKGELETVPFTERKHFIMMPEADERKFGEATFEETKKFYEGTMLPSTHPEGTRMTMICKNIIDALHRGLGKEQLGSDLRYVSAKNAMVVEVGDGKETLSSLVASEEKVHESWHKEDEILDDNSVPQSQKKGQESVSQSHTSHLDEWNWEILVVNEPVPFAYCLPGGKIIVFTGLFTHFKSDAEIATIIGHQVAHAVTRHRLETITKKLFAALVLLFLGTKPGIFNMMQTLLLLLVSFFFLCQPFITNEMEIEADYIGLLLIALAGYDPRVAPGVYERKRQISDKPTNWENPFQRNRTELLAQAMEDALIIYKDGRSRHGIGSGAGLALSSRSSQRLSLRSIFEEAEMENLNTTPSLSWLGNLQEIYSNFFNILIYLYTFLIKSYINCIKRETCKEFTLADKIRRG